MFGFGKGIEDNIKDFVKEYDIVQYISTEYLRIWFDQIFETPEYKELYADMPELSKELAIEVVKYLGAQDLNKDVPSWEPTPSYELAKKHAIKWADDVMDRDNDFSELRVQTLRFQLIYSSYNQGIGFKDTSQGVRTMEILKKYGGRVPEEPTPKKFTILIKEKWIPWLKYAEEQGLIEKPNNT